MSLVQQFREFVKEIDVKNKEKGQKYIKHILIIPIAISFILSFFINPAVPNLKVVDAIVDPILIYSLNWYFLSISFLVFGVFAIILVSTGQVAKPRLQKPIDNARSIFEFIINSPNKKEILQILQLLKDIIKKNAIKGCLELAQIFESLYKRIGRVEERMDEFEKINMDEYRKVNLELERERTARKKAEQELMELKPRIEELERHKKETDQLLNEKIHAQNQSEDTKS